MTITIGEICTIKYGVHAQPSENGSIPYLMVRQFDAFGCLENENLTFVEPDSKLSDHFLNDGDVLFVGKGNRLFAWCYKSKLGPYIPSSIFFVLKPEKEIILPDYLAIFLNSVKSKSALLQLGGGTNILSIRKSELSALEILIPSIEKQRTIVTVAGLHQKDLAITQQLLNLKQQTFNGILSKLVK